MGDLWRSEEMSLVQLYIQSEAAHETVDELGEIGLIQFKDLNKDVNAFQRHFVEDVKRADEMERQLRYLEQEIQSFNEEIKKTDKENLKIVFGSTQLIADVKEHMDELATKLTDLEKQVSDLGTSQEGLNRNRNQLIEFKHVLQKDQEFFASTKDRKSDEDLELGEAENFKLGFVTGLVARSKFPTFQKILFRAAKGNLFMKFSEVKEPFVDPSDGSKVPKVVFIVFYQGKVLQTKLKKICESFSANIYTCPESKKEREQLLAQLFQRLKDVEVLLEKGFDTRYQLLLKIGNNLENWKLQVIKEKSIYHTLNMFNYDVGRKCLIAEGWCPTRSIETVQLCLRSGAEKSGAVVPSILNVIPSKETPPTYFKTNKFTKSFQNIVDAYGSARYREINPAVFTIITFPFEFALMYGDVGHGILLLIFALLMIFNEKRFSGKNAPEMLQMPFSGRYVILLMAIFSIYQGALYNEFFAVPMDFGSRWKLQIGPAHSNNTYERTSTTPYVFGVDPVWKGAENELLFYNSLKMKMSIIIGVTQMTLGLILKLLNAIYFKHPLDIWFEFVPQIVFLWAIFGYLCFLIVYKWMVPWMEQDQYNLIHNITTPVGPHHLGTGGAPVLLNQLIFMFMFTSSANPLYPGQDKVQSILVLLALIAVPMMMIPKPLILYFQHKNKYKEINTQEDIEEDGNDAHKDHKGEEEEFDISEIAIHQVLETIEFVLGSISHTASYLRLWALSLAHSELATVFWTKILSFCYALAATSNLSPFVGGIVSFIGISIWFGASLNVLLFMESLSAFLHALRLHWVEFQSKFYKGDGYSFVPFSYQRILSGEDHN